MKTNPAAIFVLLVAIIGGCDIVDTSKSDTERESAREYDRKHSIRVDDDKKAWRIRKYDACLDGTPYDGWSYDNDPRAYETRSGADERAERIIKVDYKAETHLWDAVAVYYGKRGEENEDLLQNAEIWYRKGQDGCLDGLKKFSNERAKKRAKEKAKEPLKVQEPNWPGVDLEAENWGLSSSFPPEHEE